MSLSVGGVNGSDGIDSLSSNSSVQSQIIQMLQQLENAINQLLARMSSDDSNKVGGGSSPSSTGGGSGGGMPQFAAQQPAATGGGSGGGAPAAAATPSADTSTPAAATSTPATGTDSGSGTPAATNDASTNTGSGSGSTATGLSNNAGGVPQAAATSGISPNSVQTVHTGTGDDKTFNVTNNTNRPESFTYSIQGQNKGTITLQPGQTGSFVSNSQDVGVRISPSDANGNTNPNEVLYEDGTDNPDISKVDGNKDYGGNASNMTVTLSDGRTAGDGDAIHAYAYPTDDAASMGLAGDKSNTANIVLSDA